MRRALAVTLFALGLAGCGGGSEAADSAALLAPADAPLYVAIDTDLDSEQWQQLEQLLAKFPGRDRLVAEIRGSLSREGIDPGELRTAAGPLLELVWLDLENEGENVVGLTKPKDEAALRRLLAESDEPVVVEEIEGYLAFADSRALLNRLREGGDSLADAERFDELMGELPEQALARAYLNGQALQETLSELAPMLPSSTAGRLDAAAAALEARENGAALVVHSRGEFEQSFEVGGLLDVAPAGALAFVNVHGPEDLEQQLAPLQGLAPLPLEGLASLFRGEILLYVRPALLIPEVTLVTEVEDEAAARATVERLLRTIPGGQVGTRTVAGVEAMEARFGPVAILVAAFDGRLVATTLPAGIEALRGDGERLADDEGLSRAREAAGVGDDEDVFLYVDLAEVVGVFQGLASGLAGEEIPREVIENLDPLRSLVVSGSSDGDEATVRFFLELE
jgi:hypothetical protein